MTFGVKEIQKAEKEYSLPLSGESHQEINEVGPKIISTDADVVKELVKMKYLPRKTLFGFRHYTHKILSNKFQVLMEEVSCNLMLFL